MIRIKVTGHYELHTADKTRVQINLFNSICQRSQLVPVSNPEVQTPNVISKSSQTSSFLCFLAILTLDFGMDSGFS